MTELNVTSPRKEDSTKPQMPPLMSSYNDHIRPLLDTIDTLRHLNVMKKGIQLPTIVVVGDQSSGKSSVLESLAGISLPRGQGICTRVPLVIRLQEHSSSELELQLEYQGKTVKATENQITDAINLATEEIAGDGKGISHVPLTLVVRKKAVPDLTMVDLPGITRVPVHGQLSDICEQISNIIMEYITPKESIILNVLSAAVDFSTCESIRMSQLVDKTGERMLAVVRKADKSPEGLFEKVTTDAVNVGLGYVCVRNRIGDESYEEARLEEARLFDSHPHLSKIDKIIVGFPVLAQKLVQIQAASIEKCLPEIVKKINDKLAYSISQLDSMSQKLSNVGDAMKALLQITGAAKESLKKILLQADFEEYPDDAHMHCTARMAEMLSEFSKELQSKSQSTGTSTKFLTEELRVLEENKSIALPNFIPHSAFLVLLHRNVQQIADAPLEFMNKMWSYIEDVVLCILEKHVETYPQLASSIRRAGNNLFTELRKRSGNFVKDLIEKEKITDYTSNCEYNYTWNRLMKQRNKFMKVVRGGLKWGSSIHCHFGSTTRGPWFEFRSHSMPVASEGQRASRVLPNVLGERCGSCVSLSSKKKKKKKQESCSGSKSSFVNLKSLRRVDVVHLSEQSPAMVEQAFDMKMRITVYWKIVIIRLVDSLSLHLLYNVQNLVNKELMSKIVNEVFEPEKSGIEWMLKDSPSMANKHQRLNRSIKLLKESNNVVSTVMDRIANCS